MHSRAPPTSLAKPAWAGKNNAKSAWPTPRQSARSRCAWDPLGRPPRSPKDGSLRCRTRLGHGSGGVPVVHAAQIHDLEQLQHHRGRLDHQSEEVQRAQQGGPASVARHREARGRPSSIRSSAATTTAPTRPCLTRGHLARLTPPRAEAAWDAAAKKARDQLVGARRLQQEPPQPPSKPPPSSAQPPGDHLNCCLAGTRGPWPIAKGSVLTGLPNLSDAHIIQT